MAHRAITKTLHCDGVACCVVVVAETLATPKTIVPLQTFFSSSLQEVSSRKILLVLPLFTSFQCARFFRRKASKRLAEPSLAMPSFGANEPAIRLFKATNKLLVER